MQTLPPPARRHGHGHRLPDGPLLLDDQGPDPAAWWSVTPPRPGGSAMYIELTPEQRQLQAELRQYFSNLISPEEAKEMESDRHDEAYRAIIKRMGSDGKLGVGWPKEFGGLGFGPIEQSIFVNEAHRADVPLPAVTLQTVGPTLQAVRHRTAEEEVPARHPRRRGALRDRLHRAGGGHRPGVVAHHRGPPRRRVHRQRPEGLHHRWPRRRLRLAGRAAPIRKPSSTRAFRS